MTTAHTPPRSGCGPGSAVPAGTRQEGVRGVKRTRRNILDEIFETREEINEAVHGTDYALLARLYQRMADAHNALAKGE